MTKYKIIFGIVFCGVLFSFSPVGNYFEIAKNLDIFATLYKEVNTYYVDDVDPEKMIGTGIKAMLESLDPYTNYIPEEDLAEYRTMTTGEYAGIGSLIGKVGEKNMITMPNAGFPADKAGIKIGDELIAVDGVNVKESSTSDISKLLKGKAHTKVVVTVKRFGIDKPFDISIIRGKITLNNVVYFGMVSNNIGYIQLGDFTTNATKEVLRALKQLKSKGAESFVLDVRGNPGGLLHEAVNICNLFISKGNEIVSTRGKVKDWNKTYKTLNSPFDTKVPLVVLTNSGSASAAEIVAGVIQDYDRGVIIGRRTFGKGLVQTTRPLTYNAQLKVTTAKYYTPSGRCIQALDYSHRNDDGSVGSIPDSLKTTYYTSNGRTVYDGGGINPDITVENELLAPITISLLQKGYIFEYASKYYFEHDQIGEAADFSFTDDNFNEFTNWLSDFDYDYTTQVEKNMETLIDNAKSENYYSEIENSIIELQKKISHNKNTDLLSNKKQISSILEESIASRYYLVPGEIEASFDNDPDLKAAIQVLSDPINYSKILNN